MEEYNVSMRHKSSNIWIDCLQWSEDENLTIEYFESMKKHLPDSNLRLIRRVTTTYIEEEY